MANRFDGYDDSGLIGILVPSGYATESNLNSRVDADPGTGSGAYQYSFYGENEPQPGVAVYSGDGSTSLSLEATGAQLDRDYDFRVIRQGMPGVGDDSTATAVWRWNDGFSTSTNSDWVGWVTHNVITEVFVTDMLDSNRPTGSSGSSYGVNYDSVTTDTGRVVLVLAGQSNVTAHYIDPSDGDPVGDTLALDTSFIQAHLSQSRSSYSNLVLGALTPVAIIKRPDGRLLLFSLVREIGGGSLTLWTSISDTNGSSWRSGGYLGFDQLLSLSGANAYRKMRAVWSKGQVCLTIEYTDGTFWGLLQFASDDGGATFQLVSDWIAETTYARYHDIVVHSSSGAITLVYYEPVSGALKYRRIANPFTPFLDATELDFPSASDPTNVCGYEDTDGVLYMTWDNAEDIEMARSFDGGATWSVFQRDVIDMGSVTNTISDWTITAAEGGAFWALSELNAPYPGGSTSFFLFARTGGWDGICQPRVLGSTPTENEGFGTGYTWFPFQLPDNYGYTLNGTGSSVLKATAPYGVHITTVGQRRYYETTLPLDAQDGAVAFFSLVTTTTASVDSVAVSIQVENGGTDEFGVTVRFETGTVTMFDAVSGLSVDSASLDTTVRRVYKLAIATPESASTTARATLYYKDPNQTQWSTLLSDTSFTRRVVGTASTFCRWGCLANSTSEAEWHFFHLGTQSGGYSGDFYDDLAYDVLEAGSMVLYGAPLPSPPYKRLVEDGLYISATGGPAFRKDEWDLTPRFQHPISNIEVGKAPSPRRAWRSAGDNVRQRLSFTSRASSTSTSPTTGNFTSTSIGASLLGCTLAEATLWIADDQGDLIDSVEFDFTRGMTGLAFKWVGSFTVGANYNAVTVDTSTPTSAPHYIHHNELVGCVAYLDDGRGYIYPSRIVANSEGVWSDTAAKRPVIQLEDPLAYASPPPSGTLSICYPDAVALMHEVTDGFSYIGIDIPAHYTVDRYYEIGNVAVGPVHVFGHKFSQNRTIETIPNVVVNTARDGTRSARKLGPDRRIIQASWVEGMDSSKLYQENPDPEYVAMRAGGEAVGGRGDPTLLEGLVSRVGGATTPVVYLPRIPQPDSSGADQDITRLAGPTEIIYGRLVDSVSRETVLGDELKSEVVRVTGFKLEEEV